MNVGECAMQQFVKIGHSQMWSLQLPPISQHDKSFLSPFSSSPSFTWPRRRRSAPEKRQRAPSAYNRFIKEEIQRLKSENPSMTHKEAFSTAAKNVQEDGRDFRERKAPRHSIWARTPFE
ncbi:hypothetical protein ACLB2K_038990 [Fragaria x ananassa]